LAFLPAGLRLPESLADKNAKECSSAGNVGAWVLWRPNTMPFELNRKTDSKKITWLQTQLAANRLYAASVDGLYGPQTLVALNAFQRWHGLPADSNVDAWTLFLLEHDIGKLSS
jgi:peptidoglycan hydrolase-like protein with peptidoglycan-binding domain